jgi:micrococcal nuclease
LVVNSAYEIGFEESEAGEVDQPSMRELEAHDSLLQVNEEITIRALLVDCSELRDKNGQAEPYSQEAQEYVQHLLLNADSIVAAYDRGPKQDHYSRELMYLWADGRLVQELLLEKGLAKIAYITEPNTTYLEQLQIAEEKAKSAGLNLWSIK